MTDASVQAELQSLSDEQKENLLIQHIRLKQKDCERLKAYHKNKRDTDPEYRQKIAKQCTQYSNEKYRTDPQYREVRKARARAHYHQKKASNLTIPTT